MYSLERASLNATLTKPMKNDLPPLIVAHRGASNDAPENTLPAFELAWKQNADAIEGDFQLTKDGEILCIHDIDMQRVAGSPLVVEESTSKQLRALDVGKWRSPLWAGTAVPTLAEVIATVPPGKQLFIEVKSGRKIVQKLINGIDESDCPYDQIRIISLDSDVVGEVKERAPGLKAFWLSWINEASSGEFVPKTETILTTLRQTNADGFGSSYELIARDTVNEIIKAGYEYHVWTVDDPRIARRFRQWGAASVTSNVPGRLKTALSGN